MKILFCAYDRPGHIATGPNAWIQRLIPDLRDKYLLDVHTLFIYSGNWEDCPTLSIFKEQNCPIHLISKDNIPFIADQAKEILKLIKYNNFTILVANLVIPAFYTTKYLKKSNIPVIGVLHSNDSFYKSVINKFIKLNNNNQFTHTITVSDYLSKQCLKHHYKRYSIIPCGTPIIESINIRSLANNKLKVIYAGRLEIEQKQILRLTNAFISTAKTNSNIEFTICGSGSQQQNIENLIKKIDSTGRVNYIGAIKPSQVYSVISEHHVYTLMSDYEGMPVALMEAMSCGLVPVCLSEESGINEIIQHGVNGFIVNNRENDYQEKLKLLQINHELWNQMSAKAIQTIKSKYSSDITHKQWADLLNNYKNNVTKKVKIPHLIKLDGELLYYGDNRKPPIKSQMSNFLIYKWMQLRLFIRPRARLKSIFKK